MKTANNIILFICAAVLLYMLYCEMKHETVPMTELKTGMQDTVTMPGTVDTAILTNKKKIKRVLHLNGEGVYKDSISDNDVSGKITAQLTGDSILYNLELDIKSYMFSKTDTLKITRTDTLIYHQSGGDESFFASFEGGVITAAGILLAALLLLLGMN